MMGLSWQAATDEAGLAGSPLQVLAVAQALDLSEGQNITRLQGLRQATSG